MRTALLALTAAIAIGFAGLSAPPEPASATPPSSDSWEALGGGLDGVVYDIAVDSDDNVYVGGDFAEATNGGECDDDTVAVSNIAKWDGTCWSALGAGVTDAVTSIAIWDGEVFVGDSGGHVSYFSDPNWEEIGEMPGPVEALIEFDSYLFDSYLFAGGYYSPATDDVPVYTGYVQSWDLTCTPTESTSCEWEDTNLRANGAVYALAFANYSADGESYADTLVAGGEFTALCGAPFIISDTTPTCPDESSIRAPHVAMWDWADWSLSEDWGGVNDTVFALASNYPSTNVYVGGGNVLNCAGDSPFSACDAPQKEVRGIAQFTGDEWSPVIGFAFDGSPEYYDLTYAGGTLYAAGSSLPVCVVDPADFADIDGCPARSTPPIEGEWGIEPAAVATWGVHDSVLLASEDLLDGIPGAIAVDSVGNVYLGGDSMLITGCDDCQNIAVLPSGSAPPGAPTDVSATAGDGQATVTWSAPESDGGSPITGYTVTGTPSGSCSPESPETRTCTITGLTNGASYTFTVVATNDVGDSSPSSPSLPVTPSSAGGGSGGGGGGGSSSGGTPSLTPTATPRPTSSPTSSPTTSPTPTASRPPAVAPSPQVLGPYLSPTVRRLAPGQVAARLGAAPTRFTVRVRGAETKVVGDGWVMKTRTSAQPSVMRVREAVPEGMPSREWISVRVRGCASGAPLDLFTIGATTRHRAVVATPRGVARASVALPRLRSGRPVLVQVNCRTPDGPVLSVTWALA